jgi:hypothetical protein
MIDEWTLGADQLPIIDGPCDVLWDGKWVHQENRALVQMREWVGSGNELELKQEIFAEAVKVGASTIMWSQKPHRIQFSNGSIYALAVCGMYRVSKAESELGSIASPLNNDGRTTCFWCSGFTEKKQGFTAEYDICPKCKK